MKQNYKPKKNQETRLFSVMTLAIIIAAMSFTKLEAQCTADAGTLTADVTPVQLSGGSVMISATPNGDIVVPTDYDVTYVLTSGPTLVIEAADSVPEFDVTNSGDYTIHTLVAETTDAADPNFLDLSVITFGTTTGADVLNLVGSTMICADLDVAGAPIMVETCSADAGTLIPNASPVQLAGGAVTISAAEDTVPTVPTNYEVVYVLTSGPTLIIEQTAPTPDFDVTAAGDYTIHTLVAELSDVNDPNFLDVGVIVPGTTTGGDVLGIVTNNGLCASLDVTGAPVTVFDCIADAGTLTADVNPVQLAGGTVTISATEATAPTIPFNYEVVYVLTSGPTLIIEQTGATPEFDVTAAGDYTIHTLVAELNDTNDPNFLDVGVIVPGTTTGADVLGIVTNNGLCASLDVTGAPVTVEACNADAGTLTADVNPVQLVGGTATISATVATAAPTVPTNYEVVYVLTSGPTLIIEQTGATPEFDVTAAGDYTIHTLVAELNDTNDPNFLDVGVIVPGTTTGGDVLGIVTNNGLCASLDVAGAPITVEQSLSTNENQLSDSINMFPNPVENTLTLSNSKNIALRSAVFYDLSGRKVKSFNINNSLFDIPLNISELTSGAYIVILNSDLGQLKRQIIKN